MCCPPSQARVRLTASESLAVRLPGAGWPMFAPMRMAVPSISVAIHTASMSMMKVPARMSRPTDASTSSRSFVVLLSFMAHGLRVAFGDRVSSGGRKSFLRAKHHTSLHTTAPSTPECMKHNLPAKLEMVSSLNAPLACCRGTNSNNFSRKPYSTSNDTRHHGHYRHGPSPPSSCASITNSTV